MLTYNEQKHYYIYVTETPAQRQWAEDAGFTLSTSASKQYGRNVYFTDNPYAAFTLWDEADEPARRMLSDLKRQYDASWAMDADLNGHVISPLGYDLLPFQRAGVVYALKNQNSLIADHMGTGKEQPLTANILTPDGWKTMGDMSVGQRVMGPDGVIRTVTAVYHQGRKPAYRVHFQDGGHAECGLDHLWPVKDLNRIRRKQSWQTKSLRYLLSKGIHTKLGNNKWCIPLTAPVEFSEKEFAIDPYVIGVLLGDGYLRGTGVYFSCSDWDVEIVRRVEALLPECLRVSVHRAPDCPQYGIRRKITRATEPNRYMTELRRLELCVYSGERFIPAAYKTGSVQQRLDLLRGLMDTDGCADKNRVRYSTTSRQLALDVIEIVQSLGGVASFHVADRTAVGKSVEYILHVRLSVCPFYLKRKAAGWWVSNRNRDNRYISKVEYIGDVEQQCIRVDAENGLYITDSYAVTHNTIQAICYANVIQARRTLVICPAQIRLQWTHKIKEWSTLPHVSALPILNGTAAAVSAFSNPDIHYFVISYDLARSKKFQEMLLQPWQLLILDEAHALKNVATKRTRAIFGDTGIASKAKHVLALTGTPTLNRPKELYTLARALCWEAIDWQSQDQFIAKYNPIVGEYFWEREESTRRLAELQSRLRCNFMVRRLKEDVLKELPEKSYEFAYLEPDGRIQDALAKERLIEFDVKDLRNPFAAVWGQISTIRLEMGKAKLPKAVKHIQYLLDVLEIEKLVVFSHHREVMDGLKAALKEYGVVERRGGQSDKAKQEAVEQFITDPAIRVFSGQLDSAGFGLDGLQKVAHYVVFVEPSWTPGGNEQCVDRVHRMGAMGKPILAQFLVVEGSLDERVLGSVVTKAKTNYAALDRRHAIQGFDSEGQIGVQ